ncbi:MAG: TatD family hydrolase [Hyphomonadaceae bacterium]|nr:TatD family hydrolase [Hyphomonadaceae bacterium]
MMLIDTHVNLHAEAFDADRDEVIARARGAGVGAMVTICDQLKNFDRVLAIATANPDIWCSVGAHPHYARDHLDLSVDALVTHTAHPKVIGVGETGLDRHYNHSPIEHQEIVFRRHIEAARRTDLPLIVHTREADDRMGAILEEEFRKGPFRILMHCYTSGRDLAERALALGAYISLSGILTFKKAEDVRAVAAIAPLDRIILETDCPYLAPTPHRGQRNEPAFLVDVHRYFCAWRNVPEEVAAAQMADNFYALFSKARR